MNAATHRGPHHPTTSPPGTFSDYENLLSVYVDAAFFPCLDRLDFEQEGCRVEIDAGSGEGTTPERRGVVLSEMRGMMSEPERQLEQALNRCLFPGAPYRFNAGGDPRAIPALDYETLKAYHRRHYRPANAIFLSAGPLRPGVAARQVAGPRPGPTFHAGRPDSVPCPGGARNPAAGGRRPAPRFTTPWPATRSGSRPAPASRSGGGSVRPRSRWRPFARSFSRPVCWSRGMRRFIARCWRRPGSPAPAFASNAVQATRPRLAFRCGVHGCDPDLAGRDRGPGDGSPRRRGARRSRPRHWRTARSPESNASSANATIRASRSLSGSSPGFSPSRCTAGDPAAALDLPRRPRGAAQRDRVAKRRRGARASVPARQSGTGHGDGDSRPRRRPAPRRARSRRARAGHTVRPRRQARRRLVERSRALRRRPGVHLRRVLVAAARPGTDRSRA